MRILAAILFLALASCATTTPQSDRVLTEASPNLPAFADISDVPFVDQTSGYCGPATLTMAMRAAGRDVSIDELAPLLYTPGMKGTLQEDMISASRREGMLAVRIEGLEALIHEIAAGHPVIVFENLGLSWLPNWHYALVTGYDLSRGNIILHSGHTPHKVWDLRKFERSWSYSDSWGLVILNPGSLATSGDEVAHLAAAAGLERVGESEAARVSYINILRRWPKSLGAQIGLGNLAYQRGDYKDSVSWLAQASIDHPESQAASHNLRVAQSALQKSQRESQ